jgi:hypothetical protein
MPRDLWSKYEVMTQQDRIAVGLFKKIKRMEKKNENMALIKQQKN